MEISPIKAALIHADRQTEERKANWRLCDYSRVHKNLLWQPRRKTSKATFRLSWINGMKQQSLFCYLPLAVHKNICRCQLREILSPQTKWCTFRADGPVTKKSEQHLDVILWALIFLNVHLCSSCER